MGLSTIILATFVFTTGCSDAFTSSVTSYGTSATITCYSGGIEIYSGTSTGRVATTDGSDGWEFKDAKTTKFVRVSGDCVIQN